MRRMNELKIIEIKTENNYDPKIIEMQKLFYQIVTGSSTIITLK